MKNRLILSLVAALLILGGCKARKVAISTLDSTKISHNATTTSEQQSHVDTSKTNSTKETVSKKEITVIDSSGTKTTITPTEGIPFTLDPDGTFHGQAKSVVTERKNNIKKSETLNSNVQETQGEIKGISDVTSKDSSTVKSDSATVKRKDKTVDAKPSYGAWPWVIGIVVIVALGLVLWWLFGKPKK